ncbi:MAG: PAS domain S-box protein [Acidimicrobiales bacterium]
MKELSATSDMAKYRRLAMVANALTGDPTAEEIIEILVNQGMAGMNAPSGLVALLDGNALELVAAAGSAARSIARLGPMTLDRQLPMPACIRTGEEIWLTGREEGLRRFPELIVGSADSQGWVAIPLRARGRIFGAFGLSFRMPLTFEEVDRDFVRALADIAALALSPPLGSTPAALTWSESLLAAVRATGTDGVMAVDETGRIVEANQQALDLFGYEQSELCGASIELLLPLDRRAAHRHQRARYEADPGPRPMGSGLDLVARHKDGSPIRLDISLNPCSTSRGLVVVAVLRPRGRPGT